MGYLIKEPDKCPGCKRYTLQFNNKGEHVATEWHNARFIETSSKLIGAGSSGLGLWKVRSGWTCDYVKNILNAK